MAGVHLDLLASLHVPEGAGHVSAGRHDLTVIDEPAAGEVASVAGQFPGHPSVSLASIEVIDGADIIEAPANKERVRGAIISSPELGVGLTHKPRMFHSERRHRSSPRSSVMEWREPCLWSNCPTLSASRPARQTRGFYCRWPSAWHRSWLGDLAVVSGFSSESSRWVPAGWRPGRVRCHSSVFCPPANIIQ